MPAKGSKKCSFCGEYISEVDMERGEYHYSHTGKIACESCYESGMEYASTVVHFDEWGDRYTTKFDEDFTYWSDEDCADDEYPEPVGSQSYTRTDGWRGYYESHIAEGFVEIAGGWVTGFPDDTVSRKLTVAEFYGGLVAGDFEAPKDLYWVFSPTSNVFSTTCKIACRVEDKEEIENWLSASGESPDELNYQLG